MIPKRRAHLEEEKKKNEKNAQQKGKEVVRNALQQARQKHGNLKQTVKDLQEKAARCYDKSENCKPSDLLSIVTEGNAFRNKAEQKVKDIAELETYISDLEKRLS